MIKLSVFYNKSTNKETLRHIMVDLDESDIKNAIESKGYSSVESFVIDNCVNCTNTNERIDNLETDNNELRVELDSEECEYCHDMGFEIDELTSRVNELEEIELKYKLLLNKYERGIFNTK